MSNRSPPLIQTQKIYQFKTGKRRGFQYYVQGQVKEISKNFALEIKKLEIVLKKQEVKAV